MEKSGRYVDKEKGNRNEAESNDAEKRGNAEIDCQKAGWGDAG